MTRTDFKKLKALFINCSLKKDPEGSKTRKLLDKVQGVMEAEGVSVEIVHSLSHDIAVGMEKDLTEHGFDTDDWPAIQKKILEADILVLGTPIWLGVKSSECTKVIERMYAYSGDRNDKGQYLYYGKAAGCVVTGNEDGIKACSMEILYAMSHIGYTVPPQADCGWIGEAGPGPSYGDEREDSKVPYGFDNEFTNRNATFMAWNLMHTAAMLNSVGGVPAKGNVQEDWKHVSHVASDNPEYR